MELISPHFTLNEATVTGQDMPNVPNATEYSAIIRAAAGMELVRSYLDNHAITINSWFRSEAVNRAVGGAARSQHLDGEAIDFTCAAFGNIRQICARLAVHANELRFDQLICEHRNGREWVHISFAVSPSRTPRRQVLSLLKSGKYVIGVCNPDGTPYKG